MDEIGQQLAYAKANGWYTAFLRAAAEFQFAPSLLLAIASRESGMRNIVGDGGHGYGLMQIDDRAYPDFCHTGAWKAPVLIIEKGASVLDSKRTLIEHGQGQVLHVGGYQFLGAKIDAVSLVRVAVASYNAGLWPYYTFSKGEDPDRLTTGHNYSADVLARAAEFDRLMKGA